MPYQDPRLNFTSLALSQLRGLSLNRQNLVSYLLRELVEMQDCGAEHGANDNPFMEGCSLFAMHSKSLTKWGVKITYGICQDKIDIVCIEVDPSPLPPSGPQAISIRSFSANDNYEFVRHPAIEVHITFEDLKKVAAWLVPAQMNYSEQLTRGMGVKNSFTMTMLLDLGNKSFNAALPCKEKYKIKSRLELNSRDLDRCASRILLSSHSVSADYIEPASAITMSSILLGLTMSVYDASIWQPCANWRPSDLGSLKDRNLAFAFYNLEIGFIGSSGVDLMSIPNRSDAFDLEQPLYSFDASKEDDRFILGQGLGVFPSPAIIASFGQPPCHLH